MAMPDPSSLAPLRLHQWTHRVVQNIRDEMQPRDFPRDGRISAQQALADDIDHFIGRFGPLQRKLHRSGDLASFAR